MLSFDPYNILGIPSNASEEDIKKAYRKLAQRLHPDKNHGHAGAAAQFTDITSAYNALLDAKQRAEIDKRLAALSSQGDTYFTLRVTPSKRIVSPISEEQVIYLLAEIFPAPDAVQPQKSSHPLNLTLVLDQSNSMNGTRIERVRIAAQKIISELSENDYISIVVFNDRASVIIPATPVKDKVALQARVSMINAKGGTEIYQGLEAGVQQNRVYASARAVNSVVLLTDGHTFGDQDKCIELAQQALNDGIIINALGLGSDWNDEFLDRLASTTGGSSAFINSAEMVARFMNQHIRNMSNAFAERMQLNVAPDPDIRVDMAFRLSPNPQPLTHEGGIIPLSSLQYNRPVSVLLQVALPPNMKEEFRTLARFVASGEILKNQNPTYKAVSDISIEVSSRIATDEPPNVIMDALSKLTLYRLQEKARQAIEEGNIDEATRRLTNLATRLFELGQDSLAKQTLSEAQRVSQTKMLSAQARMTIKYETRALMSPESLHSNLTDYISGL